MKKIIIAFVLSTLALLSFAQDDSITISGNFRYLRNEDSIILYVHKYFDVDDQSSINVFKLKPNEGKFSFKIAGESFPQYIDLILPTGDTDSTRNLSRYGYTVESGDNIYYSDQDRERFRGKGTEKWHIKSALGSIDKPYEIERRKLGDNDLKSIFKNFDASFQAQLIFISTYEKSLSPQVYALMKADIVASIISYKNYYVWKTKSQNRNIVIDLPENQYIDSTLISLSKDTLNFYSYALVQAVLDNYRTDLVLKNNQFDIVNCYNYLANTYCSNFGERSIVNLLLNNKQAQHDFTPLLEDAMLRVQDQKLRAILQNLIFAQGTGSVAYDFQLQDSKGSCIKLSDFRGKTVVLDFWYTGCGACAALTPKMKGIEEKFLGKNVIFVTISVDKNKEKWLQSLKQQIYSSEYTLDLFTGGSGKDHPIIENYMVKGYPTIIVIDKNGKIKRNVEDPRRDNGSDLISLLNSDL